MRNVKIERGSNNALHPLHKYPFAIFYNCHIMEPSTLDTSPLTENQEKKYVTTEAVDADGKRSRKNHLKKSSRKNDRKVSKSPRDDSNVESKSNDVRREKPKIKRHKHRVIYPKNVSIDDTVKDVYLRVLLDGSLPQTLQGEFFFFDRDDKDVSGVRVSSFKQLLVAVYFGTKHNHVLFEKIRLRRPSPHRNSKHKHAVDESEENSKKPEITEEAAPM